MVAYAERVRCLISAVVQLTLDTPNNRMYQDDTFMPRPMFKGVDKFE